MKFKDRKKAFGKAFDCEHKELFLLNGIERYEAIRKLPIIAPELICSFYKHCDTCPLFIDGKGLSRSYCVDCASEKQVVFALKSGAEFVKREV